MQITRVVQVRAVASFLLSGRYHRASILSAPLSIYRSERLLEAVDSILHGRGRRKPGGGAVRRGASSPLSRTRPLKCYVIGSARDCGEGNGTQRNR